MSLKQDRTGTRTSEDLRRRINIKGIDEAVKETDINNKAVKEMETRVNGMSESLDNTRKNYVSTQTQTFTEEQKTRARNNIGAGNSSFSGSYNDLDDVPTNIVKDSSYVHTDNNYTLKEKNKLNGISEHAEVNKIEKIKVNGVEQTINNKEVNLIISSAGSDIYLYSHSDSSGYIWFKNGFLIQWGRIAVAPSEINTDITARLTYTYTYDDVPDIHVTPITATPSINNVSCGGGTTIVLSKQGMNVYLNSQTTKAVNVNWTAKGHKSVPNGE